MASTTSLSVIAPFVCVLLALKFSPSRGAPHRRSIITQRTAGEAPRWHSPCSGSTPAGGIEDDIWDAATVPPIPHHDHYDTVSTLAEDAKLLVQELMRTYVQLRFGDPLFPQQLDSFQLQGMPEIRDHSLLLFMDPSEIQVEDSIQQAFEDISRVAVFLEQTILDELEHETNYGTSLHESIENIQERYIFPLLCQLQTTMYSHAGEIDLTVTREVMHQDFRNLSDRSLRHNRDYIVFRELEKVLQYVTSEFAILRNHHRSLTLNDGVW